MKRNQHNSSMSAQQRDLSGPLIRLGLDIGYGYVKAVTANQRVIFPSVWGVARELRYSAEKILARYPGDYLRDEQGDWFIGELALSQLREAEHRMLRGRTANEDLVGHVARVRLMKAALGKLFNEVNNGDVIHVQIATGLPVSHMRGAEQLKQALLGQHMVESDGRSFIANVTDVMVMPQPYGGLYSLTLTPDGDINESYVAERTGIIDIGRFTIDVMVDQQMEYIDTLSDSSEAGVYLVQELLQMAYDRRFNSNPGYRIIETILQTGYCRANGQPEDFREERSSAIVPLREAVINLLSTKWGASPELDAIHISGGGAVLVVESVQAIYTHSQLVQDPQFANALGYLYYAHSRALA